LSATLAGVAPVNCGLDRAGTGFLTTYAYSTDTSAGNALKTVVTQWKLGTDRTYPKETTTDANVNNTSLSKLFAHSDPTALRDFVRILRLVGTFLPKSKQAPGERRENWKLP
jgi:hypothetical protein